MRGEPVQQTEYRDEFDFRSRTPKRKKTGKDKLLLILLPLVAVVAMIGGISALAGVWYLNRVQYTKISFNDLGYEWRENPAIAQKKYSNRGGVDVVGVLHSVYGTAERPIIELKSPTGFYHERIVVEIATPRAIAGLQRVKLEQPVRILARADNNTRDVPHLVADDLMPAK